VPNIRLLREKRIAGVQRQAQELITDISDRDAKILVAIKYAIYDDGETASETKRRGRPPKAASEKEASETVEAQAIVGEAVQAPSVIEAVAEKSEEIPANTYERRDLRAE
jgi:hypothetical protein